MIALDFADLFNLARVILDAGVVAHDPNGCQNPQQSDSAAVPRGFRLRGRVTGAQGTRRRGRACPVPARPPGRAVAPTAHAREH